MGTTPFPWAALPKVDRRSSRLVSVLSAWLPRHGVHSGDSGRYVIRRSRGGIEVSRSGVHIAADLGIGEVTVTGAEVLRAEALDARLTDPTAGVARIRSGRIVGYVVAPGRLARSIAQHLFGGPDELDAPRPLTAGERAAVVVAVSAVARDLDAAIEVEGCELGGPQVPRAIGGEAAVVTVAVSGTEPGTAAIVLPLEVTVMVPRPGVVSAPWLDSVMVTVPVLAARAELDRESLGRLRVRDVLIGTPIGRTGEVDLRVGRGGVRAALATAGGRVTVLSSYSRDPMDETLADDATLDVAIAIGDLRLSVRSLLELKPGQVLEMGKATGGAVELRVGARVIGRGELVDVDGELGVRVTSIENSLSAGHPAC